MPLPSPSKQKRRCRFPENAWLLVLELEYIFEDIYLYLYLYIYIYIATITVHLYLLTLIYAYCLTSVWYRCSVIPIQEWSDLKMKNTVSLYPPSHPQTKGDIIIYDLIWNMIRTKYHSNRPSSQNIFINYCNHAQLQKFLRM